MVYSKIFSKYFASSAGHPLASPLCQEREHARKAMTGKPKTMMGMVNKRSLPVFRPNDQGMGETLRASLLTATSLMGGELHASGSAGKGPTGRVAASPCQAAPPSPDPTLLMTVAEAARQLRLSTRTLARAIALGQVKIVRFGRSIRIPREEVDRLAREGAPTQGDLFSEEP